MVHAAILLAAGRGSRMAGATGDKILHPLDGLPVLCYSVNAFLAAGFVGHVVIVHRDRAQRLELTRALDACALGTVQVSWVTGGRERQDSVFNALSELSLLVDFVFIHDCARPAITPRALVALRKAVTADKAAVLAHRVTDTIKEVSCDNDAMRRCRFTDVNRACLWAMETPQAFERERITEAYRKLRLDNAFVTDDTAALARAGQGVTLVENPDPNPKLTTTADLAYLEFLLQKRKDAAPAPE
jgi:2-C-methyl-D-erythritol 4-phosphate cytidylyltransferase